jgi:hypothetical protein
VPRSYYTWVCERDNAGLVAWTPVTESNGPEIFSVLVHERQKLDPDLYLGLLGERVQAMFDRADNPQGANEQFQRILEEGGLLSGPITAKRGEEGSVLIHGNPHVMSRLRQLGLPQNLRDLKPVETLSARQSIRADRADPEVRLMSWASAVGVMR